MFSGLIAAINGANVVAWVCLIAGLVVLCTGAIIGVKVTVTKAADDAKSKIEEAKTKIDDAKTKIDDAKTKIGAVGAGGLEAPGMADATDAAGKAADQAATSTADAKSALEQIGSIVGSLPENLRFAGMLVLVGTVLISVATIQFGGTSLF